MLRPPRRITGLDLTPETLAPRFARGHGARDVFVLLHGRLTRPYFSLVYARKAVTLETDGSFTLEIPLLADNTVVDLLSVGPRGQTEGERVTLEMHDLNGWLARATTSANAAAADRGWRFSAGAGETSYTFQQTGIPNFTQEALTAKVALTWVVGPRWEISGNAYFTALPLKASRSDVTVIPLGANGRIGYRIPFAGGSWLLTLSGGFYYSSMEVTNQAFGYQTLMGPELFPALRWRVSETRSVSAYAKYSPVSNGFANPSLSNRELASGLAYAFGIGGAKTLSVGLDYADIYYSNGATALEATSLTLGAAIGW